jgi:hypothetical protein
MSETYTQPEFDKQTEVALNLGNNVPIEPEDDLEFFNNAAAAAAKRMDIDITQDSSDSSQEIPVHHTKPGIGKKVIAGTGIAVSLATGAAAAGAAIGSATTPEFSEETTTYTVQPGDGLYDAAENIQGSFDMRDAVDHIENLPQNAVTLEDGLQPGETISIPVSTEGYEEQK